MAKAKSTKARKGGIKGRITITGTPTKGQADYVWHQLIGGKPITVEQFALFAAWAFNEMPVESEGSAFIRLFELVHEGKEARHG